MLERDWQLADPVEERAANGLAGWSTVFRQLLHNRGLSTTSEAEAFLYPERAGLNDPFLMAGMDQAVERVMAALRGEELIAVYGDFDADGLTAAALLMQLLRSPELQGRVISYLPHRSREGYGLNPQAVAHLAQQGVRLLITVDCGIGADREIALACQLGMDVIVTDHHEVTRGVPPGALVLNPRQEGCRYPFKDLAGVGVAFKLAEALYSRIWGLDAGRKRLEPAMDLVALGTVGDVAPLRGENRLLVRMGLEQLGKRDRVGLRALATVGGFSERRLDSEAISYTICPRLNAAGRMGDARLSLELLLAEDEDEAIRLATALEAANRDRQAATAGALGRAREQLSQLEALPPAIFLTGEYPTGIVGLVAGKLAEEYRRPAFVVEWGDSECRGSGRGVPGFDVVQSLARVPELMVRYGGHQQAGGFAVAPANLESLRNSLEGSALEQLGPDGSRPVLRIDAALDIRQLTAGLFQEISLLEPFGSGNSRPLFLSRRVTVRDARKVGNGHLRMWLGDPTGSCSAIGFGMGTEDHGYARQGALVDCAYVLSRNDRGGATSYEMGLKSLRPAR